MCAAPVYFVYSGNRAAIEPETQSLYVRAKEEAYTSMFSREKDCLFMKTDNMFNFLHDNLDSEHLRGCRWFFKVRDWCLIQIQFLRASLFFVRERAVRAGSGSAFK